MAPTHQRTRRRLRFSLRSVLLLFTAVSLWFAFIYVPVRNERRAAEAIRSAGGTIRYQWQNASPDPAAPPPGHWLLRSVLGDRWFDRIEGVHLPNPWFERVGPELTRLSYLRSISMVEDELTPEFAGMLGKMRSLETLRIYQAEVNAEAAAKIAESDSLTYVALEGAIVPADSLHELAALDNLRSLKFACRHFDPTNGRLSTEHATTDEQLEAIAQMRGLEKLVLLDTRVTDRGVQQLGQLKDLEELTLSSPHPTGESLRVIATLPKLWRFVPWQWRFEPEDMAQFAKMNSLRNLNLDAALSDAHVVALSADSSLEILGLHGKAVTNASADHLAEFKNLSWLDLRETSVESTSEAADRLRAALPGCNIVLPKTPDEIAREESRQAQPDLRNKQPET